MKDQVLVIIGNVETLKQIKSLVASKKVSDRLESWLGKLGCEQLPVTVLNLEESSQVICFMLHKPNKTTIKLLVTINLVLELTFLVTEKLLFIHRQGKALD